MTDGDDIFDDDDDDGAFSTSAWLLIGITGSEHGVLRLANGRLTFATGDGRSVFDVPLSGVSEVKFPWYYFSGGVKIRIGANSYRLSFVQPNNEAGPSDIGAGRRAGKALQALLAAQTPSWKP
jgi:hypothetical protein